MLISVCICTYRRPDLLERLLCELGKQPSGGEFEFEIVVTDNDEGASGRTAAETYAKRSPVPVKYSVEPRKSISFARNRCIEQAAGDFIAFIDDDEFPAPDWLGRLYQTCVKNKVAGVLGPVRPHFDTPPPAWIIKGRFCERPEHETGYQVAWSESRTGNVLFDKKIISGLDAVFRPQFAAASGDEDFFHRMGQQGHRFLWCNEAVVYEVVPPCRWTRRYMLERALLRGGLSWRVLPPWGRMVIMTKSLVAAPVYALALPFLQLAGHHLFMRYLIKFCDHSGRLLSVVGLNPMRQRGSLW